MEWYINNRRGTGRSGSKGADKRAERPGGVWRRAAAMAALSLALSLATISQASAQHYIGVKGGYGAGWGTFYPAPIKSGLSWDKYTGGVMWKYYSPQQIVGGFSIELEYQVRGYSIYQMLVANANVSETTSWRRKTRTVNSITMPILWQPHVYFAKQRVRLFINAGVTLTYNLGIGDTYTVLEHIYNETTGEVTETTEKTEYKMITARDGRWNYGICAGLGVGVLLGPCEIFAEGRWYLGMSDILRTSSRYRFHEQLTIRSELSSLFFTVGVFFKVSKGPITEPPLRLKRQPDKLREDDFRNIKLDNMKY